MNCTSARATFTELLDPRTPATAHLDARAHLAGCPDCQREFSALSQTLSALDAMPTPPPTSRLRQNFYAMLEEEKNSAASVRLASDRDRHSRRASLWRWILSPVFACVLLGGGFFLGTRYTAPAAAPVTDNATKQELADMREQLRKMTQLVGYSLQQQTPANTRLEEVLVAAKSDKPTQKTLDDLINALALDPSANVRLRALEALYPHADNQAVRRGVVASLPREVNPLVQLEMIDFVAAARDREAAPTLEKMSANESIDGSVRDAARRALAQL